MSKLAEKFKSLDFTSMYVRFLICRKFSTKIFPFNEMKQRGAWVNCTAASERCLAAARSSIACLSKTICCCLDWLQSFAESCCCFSYSHVINCQKTLLLRFYEKNLGYLLSLGYGICNIGIYTFKWMVTFFRFTKQKVNAGWTCGSSTRCLANFTRAVA